MSTAIKVKAENRKCGLTLQNRYFNPNVNDDQNQEREKRYLQIYERNPKIANTDFFPGCRIYVFHFPMIHSGKYIIRH